MPERFPLSITMNSINSLLGLLLYSGRISVILSFAGRVLAPSNGRAKSRTLCFVSDTEPRSIKGIPTPIGAAGVSAKAVYESAFSDCSSESVKPSGISILSALHGCVSPVSGIKISAERNSAFPAKYICTVLSSIRAVFTILTGSASLPIISVKTGC